MSDTLRQSMIKNGLLLGAFAIVTTGLIALTFFATKEQISHQQQQKLLTMLHAVIDKNSYDNAIEQDCVLMTSKSLLGSEHPQAIYRATLQGQPVAAAIETTAVDGYSGKIHLVVGLTSGAENTAKVTGVRVLDHKETPGLGDKIELRISDWILDFDNRLYHPDDADNWAVKKDGGTFDQFTGATITPRAVVNAVKLASEFYMQNQSQIFNADNACATSLSDNQKSTT